MTRLDGGHGRLLRYEINCFCCGSAAIVRNSEQLNPLLKRMYYICQNEKCKDRRPVYLEHVAVDSPSRLSNPEINLPPTQDLVARVESLFGQLPEIAQERVFSRDLIGPNDILMRFICLHPPCEFKSLMRLAAAEGAPTSCPPRLTPQPEPGMRELIGDLFEQLPEVAS